MPIRNLFVAIQQAGTARPALRPDAPTWRTWRRVDSPGAFVDVATVVSVTELGSTEGTRSGASGWDVVVMFRGQRESAAAATDEPLKAGQSVFVSRSEFGQLVIHGSVR